MAPKSLKIVVEQNVPYLSVLKNHFRTQVLPNEEITRATLADADALITRTRTRCDADLLEGTNVKFIGTATIGMDHIDRPWCEAHGIRVANAPGCNAPAVAQYVFSSILQLINRQIRQHTIGIVGVGHVGRIVEEWARSMDMKVLLCDPPRRDAEGGSQWCELDTIARRADIITFHTPLTADGPYPTFHLADGHFFRSLRRAPIVINAARGPIVDTAAWIDALDAGITGPAVVDCWEGEPLIDQELLARAAVATPHIAGYSRQGKIRASQAVLTALCQHFGMDALRVSEPTPAPAAHAVTPESIRRSYDPMGDTYMLRQHPEAFEQLRNRYPLRDEVPERWSL